MNFTSNQMYHIYNQGNNRCPIFFKEKNYHYFLKKMKRHLVPYVDFLGYCLMPNHFHWLVWVKPEACWPSPGIKPYQKHEARKPTLTFDPLQYHQQNLVHAISVLLRSYTQAINRQENRTGSLFRKHTKAKAGWKENVFTPGLEPELMFSPDSDYARQCLQYIHNNPVRAGLVLRAEDWPYSSAAAYAGHQPKLICNLEKAEHLGIYLPG